MHSLSEFINLSTDNVGNKDCFIRAMFASLTSWALPDKCHQLSFAERAQKKIAATFSDFDVICDL